MSSPIILQVKASKEEEDTNLENNVVLKYFSNFRRIILIFMKVENLRSVS